MNKQTKPCKNVDIDQLVKENTQLSQQLEKAKTQLKTAHQALKNTEKHYRNIFDHSIEGIVITDKETQILEVNQSFSQITGYSAQEAIGQTTRLSQSGWHRNDFYEQLWHQVVRKGYWHGEITDRRKNGEIYEQRLTICRVQNEQGEVSHYIGIFSDITEQKLSEERMYHLAYYDTLTKLPNRALLHDRLTHAIDKASREHFQLAVLFIDLDNFKNVNDCHGHHTGDQYLQKMAKILIQAVRKMDTVARWGGDEFIIILEKINDPQEVEQVAKSVISNLGQPITIQEQTLYGGGSVGISLYPDDGKNANQLIKNADTAMYDAKDVGKNDYRFYSEELNVKAFQRLRLENELHHALENDEFTLHFQPTLSLQSGKVIAVEALIRWQHNELGLITPQRFIPYAEKSILIEKIGKWVLKTACQQLLNWQTAGITPCPITINISDRQLRQGQLVPLFQELLAETDISPSLLQLELTESSVMHKPEEVMDTLCDLKALGLLIAIDDFGTGYSSLSYLKRLPINKVKVDQSFIRNINNNEDDQMILEAIIALSKKLGLTVLAEGVESLGEAQFLEVHGCDEVQGYYYHRPMCSEDLTHLLTKSSDNQRSSPQAVKSHLGG